MLAKKRWKDLKGAEAYDVSRGVLVSTTDVRRSNSAAMYLALTSYAKNGDVVTDRAAAEPLARQLAELFKRQGYQENYVNGNFDDYVAIGIGKTPMAFIYEYQLVSLRAGQEGRRRRHGADVPAADDRQQGRVHRHQRALAGARRPARQQRRAAEASASSTASGSPTRSTFMQAVKPTGLAVEERVTQVVDPPSFDLMAEMIDVVTQEMAK